MNYGYRLRKKQEKKRNEILYFGSSPSSNGKRCVVIKYFVVWYGLEEVG